jgi:chemotaxis protein methyltransferase WspC
MSLSRVEALVRDRLGLDPEALGTTALARAVEQRMNAIAATTTDDYLEIVTTDLGEQQALAAELVVPETWFFRGGRPLFDTLAGFISARAATRPTDTPVRVLSVPCSTGEEPFSLVIALQEHQVRPTAYRIEGVDLSVAHLTRARAARFTTFSFRDTGPDIRSTHFQQTGDRWELHPALRENVRFRAGNASDPNFLVGEPPFDLILCRNLFIYLTGEARCRALANLDRLLSPDGWLVLSPAEADRLPPNRFAVTGSPEFGIYRRASVSGTANVVNSVRLPARKAVSRPATPQQRVTRTKGFTCTARPEPVVLAPSLEVARELADAGQLAAARAVCEQLLAHAAGNPNIYSLLGEIYLSEGRLADAIEAFRKVLYLDPNHPDALSHMIVICDSKGDAVQAAALRKRLARLAREEPT